MGLISDAMVLAKSGHAKTSGALNLISNLKSETEWLVWSAISTHITTLRRVWWEQPEKVRKQIDAFRRSLFNPLVEKLGYEFSPNDSTDVRELRTLAISQSASAGDENVLAELKRRFTPLQEKDDDSLIPADLQRIIFANAVKHGGRAEYETIKKVYNKPPTPAAKVAAMLALTATRDQQLIQETFDFLLKEVQLQDWFYIFMGMAVNREARRPVAEFCMKNYEEIDKRFEGNFSISHVIKGSFETLTDNKDADGIEAFFKGKDVSKYNLALAQSLDAIRANHVWLERSKADVAEWFENWTKNSKL
jgi:aminopeptidase 2